MLDYEIKVSAEAAMSRLRFPHMRKPGVDLLLPVKALTPFSIRARERLVGKDIVGHEAQKLRQAFRSHMQAKIRGRCARAHSELSNINDIARIHRLCQVMASRSVGLVALIDRVVLAAKEAVAELRPLVAVWPDFHPLVTSMLGLYLIPCPCLAPPREIGNGSLFPQT
jgi:hypothetical protein